MSVRKKSIPDAANSPIKGYINTKVRHLFELMGRRRKCTVVYVDEFNTTKNCSFCFERLPKPTRYGRTHTKQRYYTCRQCIKTDEAVEAVGWVRSRKSNRRLTKERIERPRQGDGRMASKFKLYTKTPAVDGVARSITWNRDVNAGRNIKYKGILFQPY